MSNKNKKYFILGRAWPSNVARSASLLTKLGFSSIDMHRCVRGGLLDRVARGVYTVKGEKLSWTGVLAGVREEYGREYHVGGKTALLCQGMGHYGVVRLAEMFLYGTPSKPPKWVSNALGGMRVFYRKDTGSSHSDNYYVTPNDFPNVLMSCTELAALEMLASVPSKVTFDEAGKILENALSFRPEKVQYLLEKSKNIKAKRLFCYFASKFGHAWFKDINLEKIDLGSGKRLVVKNGQLDKQFLITVPKEGYDEYCEECQF